MTSSGTTEIYISSAIFQSSKKCMQLHIALLSYPHFISTADEDAAARKAFRLNYGREIFLIPTLLIFLFSPFFLFFLSIFGKTTSLRLLLFFFSFFFKHLSSDCSLYSIHLIHTFFYRKKNLNPKFINLN